MARKVKEWTGKTDDSGIPPRVRLRVFDAHHGVCHICRLPIKPTESWQADHVTALVNGGANAESNLAPAHSHCHLGKTAIDVKAKAKVAAVRQKHLGIKAVKAKIPSPPKAPKPVRHPPLPPKVLFAKESNHNG